MAVLGIIVATVMVTSLNASALRNDQDRKTTYALAQAKQALIGRAASDSNRPGSLPCPDTNNDGIAELLAGNDCPSYVGRLPWKTLGLPDLRDADGERLWYALSSNFRDDNSATINSTTTGTINVTGNITAANAAAIVFSVGVPLTGQNRSAANLNTPSHFLDGGNGATTTAFQSQAPDSGFNDRLMVVLTSEMANIVQKRVGKEIAAALDAFYSDAASGSKLPYAADPSTCSSPATCIESPMLLSGRIPARPTAITTAYASSILGDTPSTANGWFNNNGWRQLIQYSVAAECVAVGGCKTGGFTVNTGGASPPDSKVTLTLDTVSSTGSLIAQTQNLQ